MMNYKGYAGILRVDQEAGVLRGRVINTRDTITFQGKTVEEATTAFRESVDDYLEFCGSLGEPPEKPFSGKLLVRIPPAIHRGLSALAQARGTSVNKIVVRQLTKLASRGMGRDFAASPVPAARASKVRSGTGKGAASPGSTGKGKAVPR